MKSIFYLSCIFASSLYSQNTHSLVDVPIDKANGIENIAPDGFGSAYYYFEPVYVPNRKAEDSSALALGTRKYLQFTPLPTLVAVKYSELVFSLWVKFDKDSIDKYMGKDLDAYTIVLGDEGNIAIAYHYSDSNFVVSNFGAIKAANPYEWNLVTLTCSTNELHFSVGANNIVSSSGNVEGYSLGPTLCGAYSNLDFRSQASYLYGRVDEIKITGTLLTVTDGTEVLASSANQLLKTQLFDMQGKIVWEATENTFPKDIEGLYIKKKVFLNGDVTVEKVLFK